MTLRTPSEAVEYARTHLNTGYNGMCLAHVQDAYGAVPVDPSAIAAWNNSNHKHPTTDLASAPYGAPIYWSQPGNPYGHIALHLDGDRMYTTDSGVGYPHEDSIGKWQNLYGYQPLGWTSAIENQPIPQLEENDMTPEDVWNFEQNGVKMRDRVQGTDTASNAANNEVQRVFKWDEKTHQSPLGNLVTEQPIKYNGSTAKLGDRIGYIDAHTHVVDTKLAALAAAVDGLAKAMGADPNQIAQIVEDAVKAKLDSLEIKVTAN